jgi:hypothetical protein
VSQAVDRLFEHLKSLVSGTRELRQIISLQWVDHAKVLIESQWPNFTPDDIDELDRLLTERTDFAPAGQERHRWRLVWGSFDRVRKEKGSGQRLG